MNDILCINDLCLAARERDLIDRSVDVYSNFNTEINKNKQK